MTELRWILLIVGVVVIAAIYIVGRRSRVSASDAPQTRAEGFVPQLDQPIRARTKSVEPMPVAYPIAFDEMDDLPPMHADASVEVMSAAPVAMHTPMSTVYEPVLSESSLGTGMSTGAFIAAQARAQHSEAQHSEAQHSEVRHSQPITRKLDEPSAVASMSTPVSTLALASQPVASPPAAHSPAVHSIPASPQSASVSARPIKKPASRKIVALRLSAGSERVDGTRLKSLLEAAGLRHGKYSIYHRLDQDEAPLFSVASMVEPGTFDPYAMNGVQFPGVTIFMQLPGPIDGSEMFAQMLACARELEQGIGGLLQDERGLPLTEQRAQRLREDVADFLHLLGQS